MRPAPGAASPSPGSLGRRVTSVLLWCGYAILVVVWLPLLTVIFAVTAPFDPGRYTVGRWFRRAAVVAVRMNPLWRFRTTGVVIDDPRRPYVAVSNHESFADIFLISMVPWEMKWLSKDAIFRIPVMGWMMRMADDIRVQRRSRTSRSEALTEIRRRLERNVSVMIMPEGTRSPTDELLPFRDGAFRVAIETGAPILPMAVAGTRDAMAKGSLLFGSTRAAVRVLEPIETEGMGLDQVGELRDRVRELIDRARRELRRELAV